MDTNEEFLMKSFCRLSDEKRAEILGMAEALTFAQLGKDKKAMSPITRGKETGYAGQRSSAASIARGTA
jgi:hypothetical protein